MEEKDKKFLYDLLTDTASGINEMVNKYSASDIKDILNSQFGLSIQDSIELVDKIQSMIPGVHHNAIPI